MLGNQTAQVFLMNSQRVHAQYFYQFRVHAFAEFTVFVEHVGESAGHACTEVDAGFAENTHDAAGHIFTAVVANTFNHGNSAGVTHRKTLTRTTRSKQAATGSTIQAGVTNDARLMATESRANRRTHCQQAARHAFTDIVVGIAGQIQLHAARVPHAEALACGTAEVRFNRVRCQPLIAMRLSDIARQRCADGTVGVADIEPEGFALALVDKRFRLL